MLKITHYAPTIETKIEVPAFVRSVISNYVDNDLCISAAEFFQDFVEFTSKNSNAKYFVTFDEAKEYVARIAAGEFVGDAYTKHKAGHVVFEHTFPKHAEDIIRHLLPNEKIMAIKFVRQYLKDHGIASFEPNDESYFGLKEAKDFVESIR